MESKIVSIGQAKKRIKNDPKLSKMLVRSGWRDIALDLTGNGYADIAFYSGRINRKIDTIALDLTGNGEYNLYLYDSDGNDIPDTIIKVNDDGEEEEIVFGGEVELGFINIGVKIANLLVAEEYLQEELGVSIEEMAEYLKENADTLLANIKNSEKA